MLLLFIAVLSAVPWLRKKWRKMKLMTLSNPSIKGSQIIPIISMKNASVGKSVALGHSNGGKEKEDDNQAK